MDLESESLDGFLLMYLNSTFIHSFIKMFQAHTSASLSARPWGMEMNHTQSTASGPHRLVVVVVTVRQTQYKYGLK